MPQHRYGFIFTALLMCLNAGAANAAEVRPIQNDELNQIRSWSPDDIESIATNEPDNAEATRGLVDGSAKTFNKMNKLLNSSITIRFKKPMKIGRLALQQGGWPNWAYPKDLVISADSKEICSTRLELLASDEKTAGKSRVQSVPINMTLTELTIRVTSTYQAGRMAWGGFAEIGEAVYGPARFSFTGTPLRRGQDRVRLVLDASVRTNVEISAYVDKMKFVAPPITVNAGEGVYELLLNTLKPAEDYGFNLDPVNLDSVQVAAADDTPVHIRKVEVDSSVAESWKPLPPIQFPTQRIDGKNWREGLSYQTAGRFGNSAYNGLLTETVTDSWFRVYTANSEDIYRRQDFDLNIAGLASAENGREDKPWKLNLPQQSGGKKTNVNWTTMVRTLPLEGGGEVTYHCGILVPGFLIDSDKKITLSSRGGGKLPRRSGAPDEEEGRFFDVEKEKRAQIGPAAILTSKGLLTKPESIRNLSEPWIVAIWGLPSARPTFWKDQAVAILLTSDAKGTIEWTANGISLPAGRWGISSAFHGLLPKGWQADQVTERARLLTRMLRTYPVDCREYYHVENDVVRIRNDFSYERWGNKAWQSADYAPIPPIYSRARDSVHWTGIPQGETAGFATPCGPYRWQNGSVLQYELPRIASEHAAYPRRPEFDEQYRVMESDILDAFKTQEPLDTLHPWKIAYKKRWTHTLMGAGYLRPDIRDVLTAGSRNYVERMFDQSSWIYREELFSRTPYYIKGWIDYSARPVMFGDPNSNVGQAVYSLYAYVKYTGDWDLARKYWPRAMDMLRIFEVLNDWAVPETTSREAIKYGAIDMDTIGYCGVAAMERMAQVLGKNEDLERITYLKAKIAASTSLRFNLNRYLDPSDPTLFAAGFAEDGPHLEHAKTNSFVGLDHIAMCLTWTGETPEMYDFYFRVLTPEFFRQFQLNLMDKYFSDWRTMSNNQGRSAAHIACRARIYDWPADKLKEDLNIWLKHLKRSAPPVGSAGMFGAYTAHDTGLYIVNWEPAKFISATYDGKKAVLIAELESSSSFTVELHSPKSIVHATLNNQVIAPESIIRKGQNYQIPLLHGGKIVIQFAAEESDSQKSSR